MNSTTPHKEGSTVFQFGQRTVEKGLDDRSNIFSYFCLIILRGFSGNVGDGVLISDFILYCKFLKVYTDFEMSKTLLARFSKES